VHEILKSSIKQKKDSKVICTIFAIIDYYMYLKEGWINQENKSEYKGILKSKAFQELSQNISDLATENTDISSMLKESTVGVINKSEVGSVDEPSSTKISMTPENVEKIENTIAVCIYLILTMDYTDLFKENYKEFLKEDTNKRMDVIGNLARNSIKGGIKYNKSIVNIEQMLLTYIFKGAQEKRTKELFGQICYTGLISLVLQIGFYPTKSKEAKDKQIKRLSSIKNSDLIKNKGVLIEIIKNLELFNLAARLEFFNDLKNLHLNGTSLSKEILEDQILFENIFNLSKYNESCEYLGKLLGELLYLGLLKPFDSNFLSKIMLQNLMNIESEYAIKIMSNAMGEYLEKPTKVESKVYLGFLYVVYFIEDLYMINPSIIEKEEMINMVCRIVCVLNKLQIMYVSVPGMPLFYENILNQSNPPLSKDFSIFYIIKQKETQPNITYSLREGGFPRILLKIIFLIVKFSKSPISLSLLRFYILRDNACKSMLKQTINIIKKHKFQDKKLPLYNLLDITMKNNPEKIKTHQQITENFINKSLSSDMKKLVKNTTANTKNIYENNGFIFYYLLANIMQLIHFEYLNISHYKDFPTEEKRKKEQKILADETKTDIKIFSDKLNFLTKLLSELIKLDINFPYSELQKFTEDCKSKIPLHFLPKENAISLTSIYNILDHFDPKISTKFDAFQPLSEPTETIAKNYLEKCLDFAKGIESFLKNVNQILKDFATDLSKQCEQITILSLGKSFIENTLPFLVFTTSHNFYYFDFEQFQFISKLKILLGSNKENTKNDIDEYCQKFAIKLENAICEKFGFIPIPKKKIDRDELRENFKDIAGQHYKKLYKELSCETQLWFNNQEYKQNIQNFTYCDSKYQKLLTKCKLYKTLKEQNRVFNSNFGEFVKLRQSRDLLGRAQRLSRINFKPDNPKLCFNSCFGYLRSFYLKKLMLSNISMKTGELIHRKYFSYDFEIPIFKYVITNVIHNDEKPAGEIMLFNPNKISEFKNDKSSYDHQSIDSPISELSSNMTRANSASSYPRTRSESILYNPPNVQFDECIPKSIFIKNYTKNIEANIFEAELITINGSIFGNLTINSYCLAFNSQDRKFGRKYRFGSTAYNHYTRKINKKWLMENIREIVVKRYNLIRQAVEIYFADSKSIFVSLFHPDNCKSFIKIFKDYTTKKSLHVNIVKDPEKFFAINKFHERWEHCKMSNFEYLMTLNKYGGRTFNDIGQHYVFPWIISDYSSNNISLKSSETYRNLKYPIAALTPIKREAGDIKLNVLLNETDLGLTPFQFGSHYLAGRMVLGYLMRLEPFASILMQFENGQDATSRMFHMLETQWYACNYDVADNKELIPEFFYLPEIFANYNKYSFGLKQGDVSVKELDRKSAIVRVDQVVVPPWAKNNHEFVKMQVLALESRHASNYLDHWIDLVFGEAQQDQKRFNRFKESCDESFVNNEITRLSESRITEIQEFGSNPIKLFRTKHVSRDKTAFEKKTSQSIFPNENWDVNNTGILTELCNFGEPISTIDYCDKKLLFSFVSQKLRKSKDDLTKATSNLSLEKQEIMLIGFKKFEYKDIFPIDYQKTVIPLYEQNLLITCRHYDNSCKISTMNSESTVLHNITFHKSMVTCACVARKYSNLFTGAQDGSVAMWDISNIKVKQPKLEWFACDHKKGIVSMDASKTLDLLCTAGFEGTVVLRVISTGKFLRIIKKVDNEEYGIHMIRLSMRGYILVVLRSKFKQTLDDQLAVYSINGELIKSTIMHGKVNSIIIDEMGYQFITGGNSGMLYRFDLLSLENEGMLDKIDKFFIEKNPVLNKLLNSGTSITALNLVTNENGDQFLVIGMNSGNVLMFQYVNRAAAEKMWSRINKIISGN